MGGCNKPLRRHAVVENNTTKVQHKWQNTGATVVLKKVKALLVGVR